MTWALQETKHIRAETLTLALMQSYYHEARGWKRAGPPYVSPYNGEHCIVLSRPSSIRGN